MTKGVKLTAAALMLASGAFAQAPADTLQLLDNADFTFSESQLDEDYDAAQTVSNVSGAKNDPYNSEVGYLFSPMRFRVRALDGMYSNYYMNGLQLNDVELGRFSYGMVGGMNDAVRNQEGVSSYDYNRFGIAGIGGATNVNTRAGQYAKGHKLTVSGTNRNYVARGMYSYATGLRPSGWAFAGLIGYRWANEGVIEGTFYNSLSYFLSAEKRFGDKHTLSLVTFGSPTERAQQGASTEEAYWLANDHYYNPYWGYQNGDKRNSRVVNDFSPTAILTWDWKIKDNMKLTTAAGFKYSMYSSTALSWAGDAYDPRPDYYKNLPSSIFDVWDPNKNNGQSFIDNPQYLEQYNMLKDFWTSSKANRQINWDRMYFVNRQNEAAGGEALYYQERRHNDQMVFAFNTAFAHDVSREHKYTIGLSINSTKGMHYKTMADLLGGTRFTDIDKFAASDYGINSPEAQNDLRKPNRQIGEDDRFGYDYNIFVNKARLYGLYELNQNKITYRLSAYTEGTMMERDGKMQNGRAPENSYGKSGKAYFLGGGGRFSLLYRPNGAHTLALHFGAQSDAPLARNSFVAPRMQNNYVKNLKNEQNFNAEASYQFRFGNFSGKVSGFYYRFSGGVEQTAFYNDQESRFTYLTMSDIERQHYGVEAAFKYDILSNLAVTLVGTYSEAQYANNPYAEVNYEGMNSATLTKLNTWYNPVTGQATPLCVLAKGMRVDGTPLAAVSLGLSYNIKGWFFEANLNYYDRVYVGFSEYRRLSNIASYKVMEKVPVIKNGQTQMIDAFPGNAEAYHEFKKNGGILYTTEGNVYDTFAADQEKFDGGFMLDASIGKFIRLKKGKTLSINLSAQNITNNRDLRTGGYEQNRDDNYDTGEAKPYKFSKNSKYYYANAVNVFLNIGFKF